MSNSDHFAAQLVSESERGSTFSSFETTFPGSSIAEAYATQYRFVSEQQLPIVGYKAALTAPAAQKTMGIEFPIVGVLLEGADHSAQSQLNFGQRQILLETELGFYNRKPIDTAIQSGEVHEYFVEVSPMIELASPNLSAQPTAIDLVASNSASFGYLAGPRQSISEVDIDNLQVSLSANGDTLFAGSSGDVMGGQGQALVWLVNTVLELGYDIPAGLLFMTGSIGAMAPAQYSTYDANYGSLGCIDFEIVGKPG